MQSSIASILSILSIPPKKLLHRKPSSQRLGFWDGVGGDLAGGFYREAVAGHDGRGGGRLDAVGTLQAVAHAALEAAWEPLEAVARSGKGISAGDEVVEIEGDADGDFGGPVAAHERGIFPVFQVSGDALEQARFEACFEAVEVAAKGIFVAVVAEVNARLGVAIEEGELHADFGIKTLQPGFEDGRADPLRGARGGVAEVRGVCAAMGSGVAYLGASVFRAVVVKAGVHPLGEHFYAEAELVEVVVVLAVDVVPKGVRAEDDFLLGEEFAVAEAEVGDGLAVVLEVVAAIEEEEGIALHGRPEAGDGIEIQAAEVVAELRAEREAARRAIWQEGARRGGGRWRRPAEEAHGEAEEQERGGDEFGAESGFHGCGLLILKEDADGWHCRAASDEERAIGVERVGGDGGEFGVGRAVEDFHGAAAFAAGGCDDVGDAVGVHVYGGDSDAVGVFGFRGIQIKRKDRRAEGGVGEAAEGLDEGGLAGVATDDEVGFAVAIEVARCDGDATFVAGFANFEIVQDRGAVAAEDFHASAACALADDEVVFAVAIYIADGDAHATFEFRAEGERLDGDKGIWDATASREV